MWRYKIQVLALSGIVFIFVVSTTPVRSQDQEPVQDANAQKQEQVQPSQPSDPKAATTTEDLNIPADELKILVKPLTLEELQVEH